MDKFLSFIMFFCIAVGLCLIAVTIYNVFDDYRHNCVCLKYKKVQSLMTIVLGKSVMAMPTTAEECVEKKCDDVPK